MQETNLVTVTKLWQGFDPSTPRLECSVAGAVIEDGVQYSEISFTAEILNGARLRAKLALVHKVGANGCPAVLYMPDYGKPPKTAFLNDFAKRGYAIFSVLYGKDEACFNTANDVEPQNSIPFYWAKIARRALTLILEHPATDKNNIAVIGNKLGANIAWQVAGTDSRVTAFIPILNAGRGQFADDLNELSFEEEQRLVAVAPEAYIKRVKCPTLFVGATNSPITPIERLGAIFETLPETTQRACAITARTRTQTEYATLNTIDRFITAKAFPKSPKLLINDGVASAVAEVCADNTVAELQSVTVNYVAVDKHPEFRNWRHRTTSADGNGLAIVDLDALDTEKSIVAYASCRYSDGFTLSSMPVVYTPRFENVAGEQRSHIIYERKMGVSGFISDSDESFYLEPESVFIKTGALELSGVATLRGDLSTYALGEAKYCGHDGELLQFDVNSDTARTATVSLYSENEDGGVLEYSASYTVGDGEWQKLSFNPSDFKTHDKLPLRSWQTIKKLSFKNATGMIFNNLIWV